MQGLGRGLVQTPQRKKEDMGCSLGTYKVPGTMCHIHHGLPHLYTNPISQRFSFFIFFLFNCLLLFLGMAVHVSNPSTWEVKAEGLGI